MAVLDPKVKDAFIYWRTNHTKLQNERITSSEVSGIEVRGDEKLQVDSRAYMIPSRTYLATICTICTYNMLIADTPISCINISDFRLYSQMGE